MAHRRVTYKLYPSAVQAAAMEQLCELHRALYNAALEERIDAYRKGGIQIGYFDQTASLKIIRAENPEYQALSYNAAAMTLRRLDIAFSAFFRRTKSGDTPGFPRFKSASRFTGFSYRNHADGYSFRPGSNWHHGSLRLSGVGCMQARGMARTPGKIIGAHIQRKVDGWWLSLSIECSPARDRTNDLECGLDWGVATFATIAYGLSDFRTIETDLHMRAEMEGIKSAQRTLSAEKLAKKATMARRRLARKHRRVCNRRKDFLHKASANLVRNHALIVTEDLDVQNMVKRSKKNRVRHKVGLSRAILDSAPGSFNAMLAYKAEEAGCRLILLDPLKTRPSQTDPISGVVRKKTLAERHHTLPDGTVIGRDEAAALVMLRIGLKQLGREPAWGESPEANLQFVRNDDANQPPKDPHHG